MTQKKLFVTFQLDADAYEHLGENRMLMAQQDAYEMIFKRAEQNVLESLMRSVSQSSGNEAADLLFRDVLKEELRTIQAAAASATYEIREMS
jgi:hypothetical protein